MATRFHTPTPHWTHALWFIDRTRWWWLAGLVLIYAAGFNGQWRMTPDSALHVEAARALLEGGEPVVDPARLATVQPGLGFTLAAAGRVGGGNAREGFGAAAMLAMAGFAGVALLLTYRLLSLHADRPTAVLVTLLVGSNHLFYEMSLNLLTELPFTVGFLLVLWGHEERLKRRRARAGALALMAAGVLLMAAFRSVAAVVVAGYLLAELIRVVGRRDQRRLGLALLGIAAAAVAGLWWSSSAVRDDTFLFFNTLRHITAERLLTNARELYDAVMPEALLGVAIPPPIAWAVTAGIAGGAVMLLRLRLLWAVLVGVFVVQWLVFLPDLRYVLPLLPVLIYGGWSLLIATASRLPGRAGNFLFGFVLFCVVAGNLIGIGFTVADQRHPDFYAAYRHGKYVPVLQFAETLRRDAPKPEATLILTTQRPRQELAALAGCRVTDRPIAEQLTSATLYLIEPADDALLDQLGVAGLTPGPSVDEALHPPTGETWTLRRVGRAD